MSGVGVAWACPPDPAFLDLTAPSLFVAWPVGPPYRYTVARADRRETLARLVAAALRLPRMDIEVAHEPGHAPRLVRPSGGGLHLSCASRAGLAVAAVGRGPIGVDVEVASDDDADDGDVPWNVLHPGERDQLRRLPAGARADAFLRVWTLKEAFLKARGTGLSREPAAIEATLLDGARATLRDAPAAVTMTGASVRPCPRAWVSLAFT